MRSLHTDLRFTSAPFEARGAYLLLLGRARELPTVLEVLSPTSALAAVTGTSPRRAATLLAHLRSAGLVSADGLELLVGAPRPRSRRATGGEGAEASGDELRDRLRACGRSLSEVARTSGVARQSLTAFVAGTLSFGEDRRRRLAAALDTMRAGGVAHGDSHGDSHGDTHGVTRGDSDSVTPPALPASPPSLSSPPAPPSDSPSDPSLPLTHPASSAGAREGQGKVEGPTEPKAEQPAPKAEQPAPKAEQPAPKAEQPAPKAEQPAPKAEQPAPKAEQPAPKAEQPAPKADEKPAPKRAPKPKPEAPVDPVPAPGTAARRVYDAIVGDRWLQPITAGPGEFAERVCRPDYAPGVDVPGEVARAAEWLSARPTGAYRDGRAFLRNWLTRAAERARMTPKPATGAPSTTYARPDSRGRIGPAPMCTASDFEDYEELSEAELFGMDPSELPPPRRKGEGKAA